MATTQYIGARYVPIFADPVEWSIDNSYEHLMMVQHLGDTYISQQYVPVGVNLPDISQGEESNEYWVHMSNWNAQIEAYREEVLAFSGRISAVEEKTDDIEKEVQVNAQQYNRAGKFLMREDNFAENFIIAHQGFDNILPGNTIDSYNYAATHYADAIECDLYFTSDNIPVCAHNNDLSTFTNGTGSITTSLYTYLQTIDINQGVNVSLLENTKIPLFESYIQICAQYGKVAVIDIKSHYWDETQFNTIFDILDKFQMRYNCIFISSVLEELVTLREYDSQICLMYIQLASSPSITEEEYLTMVKYAIDIDADINPSLMTDAFVNEVRSYGIYLACWTITDAASYLRAIQKHINMLTLGTIYIYPNSNDSVPTIEVNKLIDKTGYKIAEYLKDNNNILFGYMPAYNDDSTIVHNAILRSMSVPLIFNNESDSRFIKVKFNPFIRKANNNIKIALVGFNYYSDTLYKFDYTGYIETNIEENEEVEYIIPLLSGLNIVTLYIVCSSTDDFINLEYINGKLEYESINSIQLKQWGADQMPGSSNDTTFIVNEKMPMSDGSNIITRGIAGLTGTIKVGTYSVSKTTGKRTYDGINFTVVNDNKYYTIPAATQNTSDISNCYIFYRLNDSSNQTVAIRGASTTLIREFLQVVNTIML